MLRKTLLCLLTLLTILCVSANQATSGLTDGLVAYYPFNGNANDESGNGHHGINNGATATTDRFGNATGALRFNGSSAYVELGSLVPVLSGHGQGAISLWFRADPTADPSVSTQPLVDVGEGAGGTGGLYLGELGSNLMNESISFVLPDGAWNIDGGYINGHDFYFDGRWHHVVLEMGSDFNALYVDGRKLPVTYGWHGSETSGNVMWYGLKPQTPLMIGRLLDPPGDFFAGSIDDVRIYNRPLSEAEIQELYSGLMDGLVAYYPFNGNADDESGNDNHGSVDGATLTTDRFGNPNSAYSFDGVDDRIIVPHSESLNITSSITVSAFIKPNADSQAWGFIPIVAKSTPGTHEGYTFWVVFDNVIEAWAGNWVVSSMSLNAGQWYHVVLQFDGTHVSLYVDNMLMDEVAAGLLTPSNQDLQIGGGYASQIRGTFNGIIDDIRIYNRALSNAEIQKLYLMGASPDILVDPTEYDFGAVELGRPSDMFITISNTGGEVLQINDIYLKYAIAGDPFTIDVPSLPLSIPSNASVELPVSYNPSFLFIVQSNNVVIASNDTDEPVVEVALSGTGVVASGPPPDVIRNIQLFISTSVVQGTLAFLGEGDSGEAHYEALNDILSAAGSSENPCGQLQAAYKRVDGDPKQPDWVEGPAKWGLATAIENVMNELGCK